MADVIVTGYGKETRMFLELITTEVNCTPSLIGLLRPNKIPFLITGF